MVAGNSSATDFAGFRGSKAGRTRNTAIFDDAGGSGCGATDRMGGFGIATRETDPTRADEVWFDLLVQSGELTKRNTDLMSAFPNGSIYIYILIKYYYTIYEV